MALSRMDEQAAERLEGIGLCDHTVTAEYRIFGPPGTGKTRNLARQVQRALNRFKESSVLVTSFSRAAAAELAGRDLPLDRHQIGTLHSHCFHALGKPVIAEVHVEDWNRANPHLALTAVSRRKKLEGENSTGDEEARQNDGDHLLQELNRCRGMMLEPESWPAAVRGFEARWNRYKVANRLLDFCDLIETALHDVDIAPQNPAVVVVDEAQDLNRMQATLIRKWGEHANYFILAGDDDQTIYGWAGASLDAILEPDIPDDHKVFLKQSERVPRAVHSVAERFIRQVSRRQQKAYLPRPVDGRVERLSRDGYRRPEYAILATAMEHLERGKKIMFLASCSYMLHPIVAVLRKHAIPFHNPYRKSNGFWNPLRVGSRRSAANRILSLRVADPCAWTHGDLLLWTEWLRDGVLRVGAREVLATLTAKDRVMLETLQATFQPGALESLQASQSHGPSALLDWWRKRLAADFHKRVQFPADVADLRGPDSLMNTPSVVVGTIHSVKGGQADVVYLFPDLSQAGDAQYRREGPPRDSVIRLLYVGLTRAREIVYICQPETAVAVRI